MSKTLMGSANNLMPARCSCPAAKRRFSTAQIQTGETVDRRTKRRGVLERLAGAFLKFADPVEQDSGARLAVHSPFVADSRSRKKLRVATASYYPLALVPIVGGQVVE
jgi:hypothetical protein